jgi:two-component system phosphate regulon sensor histidine kinase PhoR
MGWLGVRAALIALSPILAVLALLLARGELGGQAALLASGACAAGAMLLGLIWARELRLLAGRLQLAASGSRTVPAPVDPILLPRGLFAAMTAMGETLAAQTAELNRMRHAEEGILERLPDPVVVLGPDRAVRRANEAARAAFGADLAAVLRHPDLRGAIDRAVSEPASPHTVGSAAGPAMGLATGRAQGVAVSVPVPVPREIQATVVGLDSALAGGAGVLVVLSDRTRERAVERMRADFVANASHELRTPLASLIGFIDTLRGPAADDPPAQARFLAIMAEQATRMNRLIDDLLSLSRIELTEHQMPGDDVVLQNLIERMAAAFEIRLKQRGITLDLSIAASPPISGDSDQLEQVLQNLFDNAVKYGREGGTIRVGLQTVMPGGRYPPRPGVILSVADDGAGIARQHLPRLTERFYRVDAGRSRAVGGTGLGLAIVKHVVNRHRGQLTIESEEGQGTTLTVWLPIG